MISDDSWEPMPTYFEVVNGIYVYSQQIIKTWPEINLKFFLDSIIYFFKYWQMSKYDVILLFSLTVLWTVIRNLCTVYLFKPLGRYYGLTPSSQSKMPESAWKLVYYTAVWSATFYIIILKGSYHFFQRPSEVWQDWSFEEPVPWDIYAIYMVQCSFYLHSLYATLVLDTWRKDSPVMLAHHLVTLALLLLSYGLRYHKTGSLILLLHDICDILLEVAKLNVYFKIQAGVKKPMFEQLANSAFLLFSVTWYVTRLYWYPLKALYTNGAVLSQTGIILPFGILMNSLLWVLQLLHVYWFSMILDFLWRVYSGQIEDLGDTREYDVAEAQHTVSPATNGDVVINGNKTSAPLTNGVTHRHHAPSC